jgi:hypothetical protein
MTDIDDVAGSTRNPPAGWYYEPADWSVGLSGGWTHETCPAWLNYTGDGPLVNVTETALGPADVEARGVYLSRLDCPCGASVVVAS